MPVQFTGLFIDDSLQFTGDHFIVRITNQPGDDKMPFLATGLNGCPLGQQQFFRIDSMHMLLRSGVDGQ